MSLQPPASTSESSGQLTSDECTLKPAVFTFVDNENGVSGSVTPVDSTRDPTAVAVVHSPATLKNGTRQVAVAVAWRPTLDTLSNPATLLNAKTNGILTMNPPRELDPLQFALSPNNAKLKRTRMEWQDAAVLQDQAVAWQIRSFKESLEESFGRSLSRLEVLDRLVQTVVAKGHVNVLAVREAHRSVTFLRGALQDLVEEHVEINARLCETLRSDIVPEVVSSLRQANDSSLLEYLLHKNQQLTGELIELRAVNSESKMALADRLRQEEESHLTDLAVMASRNRDLTRDGRTLREQIDHAQTELDSVLQQHALLKNGHSNFVETLCEMLNVVSLQEAPLSQSDLYESIVQELRGLFERSAKMTASLNDMALVIKSHVDATSVKPHMDSPAHHDMASVLSVILTCMRQRASDVLLQLQGKAAMSVCVKTQAAAVLNQLQPIRTELDALVREHSASLHTTLTEAARDAQTVVSRHQQIVAEMLQTVDNAVSRLTLPDPTSVLRAVNDRLTRLTRLQEQIASVALEHKQSFRRRLADLTAINTELRRQNMELSSEASLLEKEAKRARDKVSLQEQQQRDAERRLEKLHERQRELELALSTKNQESRAQQIRIQSLETELAEMESRHQQTVLLLERKVTALQSAMSERVALQAFMSERAILQSTVSERVALQSAVSERAALQSTAPERAALQSIPSDRNNHQHGALHSSPSTVATDSCSWTSLEEVPATAPVKKSAIPHVIVAFTGFRPGHPVHHPDCQKELMRHIETLGGAAHVGAEFSDDITHVLAPRGCRSIRVLAASLTAKWIMSDAWIEASNRAGYFVDEAPFGFLNTGIRPFRLRTLWMSDAFAALHRAHCQYPTAALRILIEKLGRGRWTASEWTADLLLVSDAAEAASLQSARGRKLTLQELVDMIPVE